MNIYNGKTFPNAATDPKNVELDYESCMMYLRKAEARIKELEQRLADEVNVSIELNRELILKRLEK